jgi:hypothetical protein
VHVLWSTKIKDLGSSTQTPHGSSRAGVAGRTPAVTSITFTPVEFFGAAARCLHTHVINPAVVTPESLLLSALVAPHVDDVSAPFGVLGSADRFKDYARSYFAGTVAAGLAYLQMIADGYVWSDHFENLASVAGQTPDFVFARPGHPGVALVESKGTRRASVRGFNRIVRAGYTRQVEPHLGSTIGTAAATHGFCLGGWLTSTQQADMLIHYTAPSHTAGTSGGSPPSTVQLNNYATAFRLAHSEELSREIRGGTIDRIVEFSTFNWVGLDFVSSPFLVERGRKPLAMRAMNPWEVSAFAVERRTAAAVLRAVSRRRTFDGALELPEMSIDSMVSARFDRGALFPDGFAVLSAECQYEPKAVTWNPRELNFEPRLG